MFLRRGITGPIMERCINTYLNAKQDKFSKDRSRATTKGNIRKQLSDDRVSWNMLRTAASILQVKAINVKVTFHWGDGMITEHNVYPGEEETEETLE